METTPLVWGWADMPKSLIFEKMLELALPIVKRYRSDFYHDAKWLDRFDNESVTFFYGLRESGTMLSENNDLTTFDIVYRIDIVKNNRLDWTFAAQRV